MVLPHYFTLLRIFISPLFPLIYIEYEWFGIPFSLVPVLLLSLLVICEFSDFIDGVIARRCNQVTDLGKVLDPMADSVTRISLFLTLTQGPVFLPLPLVLVFFYRDFFITTFRTFCALRGVALAARKSGKLKAVIQAAVLLLIVILLFFYTKGDISQSSMHQIALMATLFSAIYTVFSTFDYLFANRHLWITSRSSDGKE